MDELSNPSPHAALRRLLYDARYRERFLRDGAPPGLADLDTIDREQLKKTAARIIQGYLHGSGGRAGGLTVVFPETFAAYRESHPGDHDFTALMEAFLVSAPFERARENPLHGKGICLEEAFFLFFRERDDAPVPLREEFFAAIMKHLAINDDPYFTVETPAIRRIRNGYFAILRRPDGVRLYAAIRGAYVSGPITPLIAAILLFESEGSLPERLPSLATGLSSEDLSTLLTRLHAMGFLADPVMPESEMTASRLSR